MVRIGRMPTAAIAAVSIGACGAPALVAGTLHPYRSPPPAVAAHRPSP